MAFTRGAVTLVVGGQSELAYLGAILSRIHPWADLASLGVEIVCAKGDSRIPAAVQKARRAGKRVMVLLDRDALMRANEQADVIRHDDVEFYELRSDFEGAFDVEALKAGLNRLGYEADMFALRQALCATAPFAAVTQCVKPVDDPAPLGKVQLAEALAQGSADTWYVPNELFRLAVRLGKLCGVGPFSPNQQWYPDPALRARGRLYVCNHVTNTVIAFWDFDQGTAGSISLPDAFDGRAAICRKGSRYVLCKAEQLVEETTAHTWVHVFDINNAGPTLAERFRVRGAVSDVRADEDGNHLTLGIQESITRRYTVKCLTNGTQRERAALDHSLYSARRSPDRTRMARGPQPFQVLYRTWSDDSSEPTVRVALTYPHFRVHSFTWSPCSRFVAFFGRRGPKDTKSQDCLWILDVRTERVYRMALGDQFMPVYWT
jgi:hypothetical protein